MHQSGRSKTHSQTNRTPVIWPAAVKGLALLFILCVLFRLLPALGAENALRGALGGLTSGSRAVCRILSFEIGRGEEALPSSLEAFVFKPDASAAPAAASSASTGASSSEAAASSSGSGSAGKESAAPSASSQNASGGLYYDMDAAPSGANTSSLPPKVVTRAAAKTGNNLTIDNDTNYAVDTAALLGEPMKIKLTGNKPAVLIIHTHSSEAFMPAGNDQYAASDPFRTEDKRYSVIRVGDELASVFSKAGIPYIHDTGVYDYPSYEGAYNRSWDAIQSYLKKYPSIKIVLDIHRDAIQAADGTVYKTIAQVGNVTCAQVMMVMGTNASGLTHPNWKENFKLALHFEDEMNQLYPTLAKPIELSQYRYNQQATMGSMIVEIGCTGNTLQESLAAARYFGSAASQVLKTLYK